MYGIHHSKLAGPWRKSKRSGPDGNCVMVAPLNPGDTAHSVAIADSKNPNGRAITVGPHTWNSMLHSLRT